MRVLRLPRLSPRKAEMPNPFINRPKSCTFLSAGYVKRLDFLILIHDTERRGSQ